MKDRKPKPTNLRLLQGNPGHRPLPKNKPILAGCLPDPPDHLNPLARQHWREVLDSLGPDRGLCQEDVDLLALYCDFYARWVKARESIDGMGLVVKSPDGKPVTNPFIAIADQCASQMKNLLGELTMTPAARRRLRLFQDSQLSREDLSRISIRVPDDRSRN